MIVIVWHEIIELSQHLRLIVGHCLLIEFFVIYLYIIFHTELVGTHWIRTIC